LKSSPLTVIGDTELLVEKHLEGKVYDILLEKVQNAVRAAAAEQGSKKNVIRIAVDSIGSYNWGDFDKDQKKLYIFVKALKALVRNLPCVVFITIPAYLHDDPSGSAPAPAIRRLEHLVDAVVELESFAGDQV
jgi:elongator complex protein 4